MSTNILTSDLSADTYPAYFQPYIELAGDGEIRKLLRQQIDGMQAALAGIDEATSQIVHSPYTWTIRQIVGHLIDSERIFGCRAHRIACGDDTALPGFDQDAYVANTDYTILPLADLVAELAIVRQGNCMMFERWTDTMWQTSGVCDGKQVPVLAIACILVGHVNHHLQIIKSRIKG